MQPYTDEAQAQELSNFYTDNYAKATPQQLEAIAQQIVAFRTSKYDVHDAGLSLCLFFGTLLIGMIHSRLWDLRNLQAMQTPRSRARLLALATVVLLGLMCSLIIQTETDWLRDDLAPTIDTGRGSITIVTPALFLTLWFPMLLIGRFGVLRRSSLPTKFWHGGSARPRGSVALNVFFGLLIALLTILLAGSVRNFVSAVPSLMICIYVLLSSRAARLRHVADLSSSTFHP
jgi:hypothetical protein